MRVKDLGQNSGNAQLINLNGILLVFKPEPREPYGVQLWRSNGTESGTVAIKLFTSVSYGRSVWDADFAIANGVLLFGAADEENGVGLWRSDGTAAGTVRIRDGVAGGFSLPPSFVTVAGSKVFFTANDSLHGEELWSLPLAAISGPCVGDCDNDTKVTVDELVRGVNIALGDLLLGQCPSFDTNQDHRVTVDELVAGVSAALNGCVPNGKP